MARNKKQVEHETSYQKKLKEYKKASDYRKPFYQAMSSSSNSTETPQSSNQGSSVSQPDISNENDIGILKLAKQQIGKPYVFGSQGPNTFDCSGLVYWVFNQNGYKFGRTNCVGLWAMCDKVDKPVAGDLIFFSGTYKAGLSHVGICANDKEYVEARNSKVGVVYSKMEGSYFHKHFTGFGRIKAKYYKGGSQKSNNNEAEARTFSAFAITPLPTIANSAEEEIPTEFTDLSSDIPPDTDEGVISIGLPFNAKYNPRQLTGGKVVPIEESREDFMRQRISWARNNKYYSFVSLNKKHFIHMVDEHGRHGNLYSRDARDIFQELFRQSKWKVMHVISGFRYSEPGQINPHECGCAIDIQVKTKKEMQFLCDLAWKMGLRSIASGGDLQKGTAFVHLDIMPGSGFSIDGGPIYKGPGING